MTAEQIKFVANQIEEALHHRDYSRMKHWQHGLTAEQRRTVDAEVAKLAKERHAGDKPSYFR